ncbi:PAS domain-containing sensor histidine kinase [Romboutsia sp. Marseille-P6047]|uniref:PAS domain-containing sensor histidine kinase n=1 Tax=Romboutsia sp. Marseille-P6047 TaxID=2161817 RepID=UPI000F0526C6|nr:PAS domain S-box protein [Romboutsia sp. Marseille-P6047]
MKSIFNKFDSYVLVIKYDGSIIFANDKLLKKLKYEEEELYNFNIQDILVTKYNEIINILEYSKDTTIDLSLYSKSKEIIKVYSDISVDYFKKNKEIFIISKDIRHKYYTIEDLENLLDNSGMMIYIKDKDSRYLYVNKSLSKISLVNQEDMLGLSMQDYLPKDLYKIHQESDKEVLRLKQDRHYNQKITIDGEEVWYYVYKSPIYDENGDFKYMTSTIRDITIEKILEDEVYKSYTQINNLDINNLNNIDMYNLLKHIGEKIVSATNADGLSILLYDKDEKSLIPYIKLAGALEGLKGIDKIPIRNDEEYKNMIYGEYDGLKLVDEYSIKYDLNEDYFKSVKYIGSYKIQLYDEFIGILNISYKYDYIPTYNRDDIMRSMCNGIAMVIKNCRLSEEIKNENEKRKLVELELENYLDIAADLVSTFDKNGKFLKVNENWTKLLGWDKEDLINKSYVNFVHPDDVNNYRSFKNMKDTTATLTNRYIHKDGRYIWLDWNFRYDEKKSIIIGTAKDITEQKDMEIQKRKLEEKIHLERIKNEFFANISHEFRTPINIILGTIQLIKKNIENNNIGIENLNRHSDTIKQNSYRLLRLVNNLIDISKVDIGYYNLKPSNHNIINIIEDITLSVADYIEHKDINLIFDTDTEEVITSCDPDKIERVMLNLLSNAIKHTPEDGSIEVNITTDDDNIIVSVKDSGGGIPSDKLDIIFDRFRQANNLLTRRCEGSGIGLSLVKAIVEMHGGKIQAYSSIGNGTEFVFNIPIKLLDNKKEYEYNYDSKDFQIEKCHIEFSDIYSL